MGLDKQCRYCGSGRTVPVLDKRIERSEKPGNKFRSACLHCERWLPMSGEDDFKAHTRPHVLPADAPSDDPTAIIPLEDYDYGPEWADLVEDVTGDRPDKIRAEDGTIDVDDQDQPQQVATDGGDDTVDADVDDDQEPEPEPEEEPEPENAFACPATGCEAEHTGYPPECDECGASYNW